METERLYYADAYLRRFTARVLSCEAVIDAWRVTLDRTAFYPEGGGQPADHGELQSEDGTVRVLDVHEKDGVVYHFCHRPLEAGAEVMGTIDWARRLDHMQQHSGEHILSGILCRRYHCDNVGFHMGADTVTIDYNVPLTWEQVLAAEAEANRIIREDRETEIALPSPEALEAMEYRSKKALTGQVRIVTFPEADRCACCGTHVRRAGEAGPVKVLSCQRFREGVRLEILCGERAYRYLAAVYDQDRTVAQRLSVKPLETAAAVERLEQELSAAKERIAALEEELFAAMARENAGRGNVLLIRPPMRGDSLRRLADAVGHSCGALAAVFAGEGGQYSYALVRGDGQDIAPLVKEMNQALRGRGGGRNGFAQGSVQAEEEDIRAFFREKGLLGGAFRFRAFSSQEERREFGGSDFFELQFCRLPKGTEMEVLTAVDSIRHWQDDSLYVDDGGQGPFLEVYGEILGHGTYNNLKTGPMDPCGINYYGPDQIGPILQRLLRAKPEDHETLAAWLEKARQYNGFYLLGI